MPERMTGDERRAFTRRKKPWVSMVDINMAVGCYAPQILEPALGTLEDRLTILIARLGGNGNRRLPPRQDGPWHRLVDGS